MRLLPWLWRVLRSKKTRTAGKIGLCLAIAVAGGFYPVANWWGQRSFEKADAELRARGFSVRSKSIQVDALRGSFFMQPAYLEEAARPVTERLGSDPAINIGFRTPGANPSLANLLSQGTRPTPIEAQLIRKLTSPSQGRRNALIKALQQSTPLADAAGDSSIEIPENDASLACHLAWFFATDAAVAKIAGDPTAALESIEAQFRIIEDLIHPKARHSLQKYIPPLINEMVLKTIFIPGCRSYDDAQLAKLDGILAGVAWETLRAGHIREMPGECAGFFQDIRRGRVTKMRPTTSDAFSGPWTWDRTSISYRGSRLWDACKPAGFYDAEFARCLRKLADVAENPGPYMPVGEKWRPSIYTFFDHSRTHAVLSAGSSVGHHWEALVARHVIAIERHRLRHGSIPAKLEDLDPDLREKLPKDYVTGEPPAHAVGGDGRFTLTCTVPGDPGYQKAWQFPLEKVPDGIFVPKGVR